MFLWVSHCSIVLSSSGIIVGMKMQARSAFLINCPVRKSSAPGFLVSSDSMPVAYAPTAASIVF